MTHRIVTIRMKIVVYVAADRWAQHRSSGIAVTGEFGVDYKYSDYLLTYFLMAVRRIPVG